MSPLLSILIPTIEGREESFNRLLYHCICNRGLTDLPTYPYEVNIVNADHGMRYATLANLPIEVIGIKDDKKMTIGEKRNLLYQRASGEYSWQIDDDDEIATNSISKILEAIKQNPDCITFQEKCIIDGIEYTSNHSLKYPDWYEKIDGFDYVRTPFMKDVIRTDLCKAIPVPHIRFGEDHQWSRLIKPHLRNEYHFDEQLYHYIHNSTPHTERYGITD